MIPRRLPLLLLVAVFSLAGCRDALVDEPIQPDVPPSAPPASGELSIYLKGPGELHVGETKSYRAEPLPEAARYDWAQSSTNDGELTGTSTDHLLRLYDLTGISSGTVQLRVSALDENGTVIGVGTKTVFIR